MTENGKLLFELLHGKTLSALAIEMGISVSNLSRVLNGKGCSKSMAKKLNDYFKITNGGFVEEKRDYTPVKKPKVEETKPSIKKYYKPSFTKPKYEKGEFVLYKDGKIGQIRKIEHNNYNQSFNYGVRLVEWCRPKEFDDHHEQYNVLDQFDEKDIKIVKKEDIYKYKIKYSAANNSNYDKKVNSIISSLTTNIDVEHITASEKTKIDELKDLINSWTESSFQTKVELTQDEKLMILKQIIYKLLLII